jgi:hypothetical protein
MKRGLTNWQNTLKQLPRPEREIIFDATSDGLLAAVLTTEGIIKLKSAGEISQSFTRGLESSGPPYIPTNADSVRITVSEMILAMRLEPFQRRILINTHDELSDGSITENQALERLTDAGFKREQLLGSASGAFRGLFELGVIGKRPKPLGNLVV